LFVNNACDAFTARGHGVGVHFRRRLLFHQDCGGQERTEFFNASVVNFAKHVLRRFLRTEGGTFFGGVPELESLPNFTHKGIPTAA